ncbi:MAG: Amidase [Caulobacteraceae bacterium]|nr:Amidase [Caulobacteraceae bacterium]
MKSAVLALCVLLPVTTAQAAPLSPYATIAEQQTAIAAGTASAQSLTRAYLGRIAAMNHAGPRLNAVLAVNPDALATARAADLLRSVRGPLFGAGILQKDNIETADKTATTAGSLALKANVTGRDAPLVARLRGAGAIVLGKANLSEWANFRSSNSVSGWSAVGGLVRNPYSLDRTACGSSSGSAVAVAAGLAAGAIGTETDGSVICPAALNGVVGLKPTLGLVSRTRIVPISPEQDTAGPIARTVADAALILDAIAGSDPLDPATRDADIRRTPYRAGLDAKSLQGTRIGVLRTYAGRSPRTDAVFDDALAALRAQGAVLVELKGPDEATLTRLGVLEGAALRAEFRPALEAYLANAALAVNARALPDLIAFNATDPRETALFGQETFAVAVAAKPQEEARNTVRKLARDTLDDLLRDAKAEVLVTPSGGPAGLVDPINGLKSLGSPTSLPAVAGYPHLTVPMGYISGLPVGLSFIGPAWTDGRLLSLGYAFEQATHARRAPTFPASINPAAGFARAYDPGP